MIVYAGKQYWNKFNNWDEALFQDANRPRDNDMFKLQSGIQARKQDLRTANSGIAAQATYRSAKLQTATSWGVVWNTAVMKDRYTASDFSDLDWFVAADGTTYTSSRIAEDLYADNNWIVPIIWRPYVNANWDVTIGKNWVYAVTCQCIFIAPTWYNVNDSWAYKYYVSLMINGVASQRTQGRGCWAIDAHSVFYVWWFDAWDKVNAWFLHTYGTRPFFCQPSINLYRLS